MGKECPGLKSIHDATLMRQKILLAFEAAESEPDPEKKKSLFTFVIVGGGPTGVELSGALSELSHHALAADFRHIDPKAARMSYRGRAEGSCRLFGGRRAQGPAQARTVRRRSQDRESESGQWTRRVSSSAASGSQGRVCSLGSRTSSHRPRHGGSGCRPSR